MTTEQPFIIKKKPGRKIQYTKQEYLDNKRKRALDAYYINKYSNKLSKFDDRRKKIEDRLIIIQDQKNQHIEKIQTKIQNKIEEQNNRQNQLKQLKIEKTGLKELKKQSAKQLKLTLKELVKNWKTLNKNQMDLLNDAVLHIATPVNASFSECDTDIMNSSGSDMNLSDNSM